MTDEQKEDFEKRLLLMKQHLAMLYVDPKLPRGIHELVDVINREFVALISLYLGHKKWSSVNESDEWPACTSSNKKTWEALL